MAESFNVQFPEFQDSVHKRYKKTVAHIIGGLRPNPHKSGETLAWQLKSPESNFDFETQKLVGFTYDEEVLEVYSETEDKLFKRLNRRLFENGLLIEFGSNREESKSPNDLSDSDVKEIAALKQITAMNKRLKDITSVATLKRIRDAAMALERSVRIIEAIDTRLEEVR